MKVCFLGCGIFQLELDKVIAEFEQEQLFDCEFSTVYLPLRVHVDLKKLQEKLIEALTAVQADKVILLFGEKCHPLFYEFLQGYELVRLQGANCWEIFLGELLPDGQARNPKTFYMTSSWLVRWREFFDPGWGVDDVAMRQAFAFYDTIVLVDTGVCDITDEAVLEFFEYAQVPIEIEAGDLTLFKNNMMAAVREALGAN
ncbi:DUF1638 domain-containing protein [Sporomusa malonica]|uniref:DUF1638 domain-containing protein n=1 Tax=Sporomusa malonica TaxID=112901 RepID=A0A1W2BVT4_9FIRM|nr:DUF1638 domain-containing protein [Sporomusa malonica]SMC76638.1 Protein of unknown function [Sporomusa malonica]